MNNFGGFNKKFINSVTLEFEKWVILGNIEVEANTCMYVLLGSRKTIIKIVRLEQFL